MSLPGPHARVVELRVPGLVGISGEQLLDSVAAVAVAGDEASEIIRPADRMRRPAPGPVLQALGRALPRTLEGYLWHRMTSGGATKAGWALLFPFSLANVAHGMLPPVPEGSRFAAALSALCRGLLRATGMLLTVLLVAQLGVITLDLFAAQCLAPGSGCLPLVPGEIRASGTARIVLGMLPLLLLVLLLHRVSLVSWLRTNPRTDPGVEATFGAEGAATASTATAAPERGPVTPPAPTDSAQGQERPPAGLPKNVFPGDTLRKGPNADVLRGLHTLAALSTVALLALGGPLSPPEGPLRIGLWAVTCGLLGLALIAVTLLDDRAQWPGRVHAAVVVAVLNLVALGVAITSGPIGAPLADQGAPLAKVDLLVQVIGAALLAGVGLFSLLLVPYALLSRRLWSSLPHRLRPWLGGWAAAPTLMLAGLIGVGFGAGLAISLRQLIGSPLSLPRGYDTLALLWGAGTVFALALWLCTYGIAVPLRRRRRGIPAIVRLLQNRDERRRAADVWATSFVERKYLHRLVFSVAIALATGAVALVALRFTGRQPPEWLRPLSALGVVALGLIAAGLLRMVYTAARSPKRSRHLGALADLVYFWPRRAHPVVPPSYALKVVPDLAQRAREHLREPNTRVVLAGYSHGGLLAVIAAGRLIESVDDEQRERIGLLTAGTPLQWGYQRAFPALLPLSSLANLHGALESRWRGLCRGTDPFGGGVTTWSHQVVAGKLLGVGYLPDGGVGPLPVASAGSSGALVLGGDHWLPDPVRLPQNGSRWAAGVLRHNDYLVDPEWDRAVAMAAGLERPGRSALSEQAALFGDLPKSVCGPGMVPRPSTPADDKRDCPS